MKHLVLLLTGLLITSVGFSQKYLTSKKIDYWPKKGVISVSEKYNRISTYLYILNQDDYLNLFKGIKYSREERKELGIKKHDKPDFLQMSLSINHKLIANGNPISLPLFMLDYREKEAQKTFLNYNGKILDNIMANEVNSNIMGEIKVNAMISNASVKFWKEVAKISADFGKSATSIALGNPSGMTDLTGKLNKYLDEGLKSLNNLSDGSREEEHSFFIDLVNIEESDKFDEIVTSARLYQIHWASQSTLTNPNYFTFDETLSPKPSQFENTIANDSLPLVLIIETRTRTKPVLGDPKFTDDYKNNLMNEFEKFPRNEWSMFRAYRDNFNIAYQSYKYINSFNSTINSQKIDWHSLINAIDFTYQFKQKVFAEQEKYQSDEYDADFKSRFDIIDSRYKKVDIKLNELYQGATNSINLQKADKLISTVLNEKDDNVATLNILYGEIAKLNHIDEFINNIGSNVQISNDSYSRSSDLRERYEKTLYSRKNVNIPAELNQKIKFYQDIIDKYSLCNHCVSESKSVIQQLKGENLQTLRTNYKNLIDEQYSTFNDCRKLIESEFSILKTQIDTTLDEVGKTLALRYIDDLENGIGTWKRCLTNDYQNATADEINLWSNEFNNSRKIIIKALNDLNKLKIILNDEKKLCK